MKHKLLNRALKYVWRLLAKYGMSVWREAKYILKQAIKKLVRKTTCTVIESLIIRYIVEPLMKYGLEQSRQAGISREEFLEGIVN